MKVRLCPRNAGGKEDSWLYYLQKGSMFTHHQKSVVLDAEQVPGRGSPGQRRLLAYIGGLDLCDGRCVDPSLIDSLFSGSHWKLMGESGGLKCGRWDPCQERMAWMLRGAGM